MVLRDRKIRTLECPEYLTRREAIYAYTSSTLCLWILSSSFFGRPLHMNPLHLQSLKTEVVAKVITLERTKNLSLGVENKSIFPPVSRPRKLSIFHTRCAAMTVMRGRHCARRVISGTPIVESTWEAKSQSSLKMHQLGSAGHASQNSMLLVLYSSCYNNHGTNNIHNPSYTHIYLSLTLLKSRQFPLQYQAVHALSKIRNTLTLYYTSFREADQCNCQPIMYFTFVAKSVIINHKQASEDLDFLCPLYSAFSEESQSAFIFFLPWILVISHSIS